MTGLRTFSGTRGRSFAFILSQNVECHGIDNQHCRQADPQPRQENRPPEYPDKDFRHLGRNAADKNIRFGFIFPENRQYETRLKPGFPENGSRFSPSPLGKVKNWLLSFTKTFHHNIQKPGASYVFQRAPDIHFPKRPIIDTGKELTYRLFRTCSRSSSSVSPSRILRAATSLRSSSRSTQVTRISS